MGGSMTGADPRLTSLLEAIDQCELTPDVRVWVELSTPQQTSLFKKSAPSVTKSARILKADEERYVLGIVLEPLKEMGTTDTQDDTYSAEEVRAAAYRFMEDFQNIGRQHEEIVNGRVCILENWITRDDSVIGGQSVAAGTWLIGVRVSDDDIWAQIKSGEITGFSIGGFAQREPLE